MELDPKGEITNLNFDGDNPHIAICHQSQGYSANLRHDALLFKSNKALSQSVIKSMEGKLPEQVLTKMLKSNTRRLLEEALEAAIKASTKSCHCYVWVQDFSDDMIIFEYEDKTHAVAYKIGADEASVEFEGEITEVQRRDMYVATETGEEIVKAADWSKVSPKGTSSEGEIKGEGQETDSQDTPKVEEDNMSKKIEMTPEQLQEEIQKALKVDRAEQEELRKAAELESNTQELVKGFAFVEEADHADLVKAIIAEGGEVLVKALEAAGAKIAGLEADLEKAGKQEVEEEKEVEVEKSTEAAVDRTKQLDHIVKARLAAKKK